MVGFPKLKICGVRDGAFARRAEELGVDYLGFIFAERSPRYVTPDAAKAIASTLSGKAKKVGVFTDAPLSEMLDTARRVPLDVVQLHGRDYGADEIFALRADGLEVWQLESSGADAMLLDGTAADGQSGGTGLRADWKRAADLAASGVRVVLAGGLSAENILAAAETGCAVLDVNSSLEVRPGVKSLALLDELFRSIHGSAPSPG